MSVMSLTALLPLFPFEKGDFFKSNYIHYYATYNPVIKRPMLFQGDRLILKDRYMPNELSDSEGLNTLVADTYSDHKGLSGGYLTNHPPRYKNQKLVLDYRFDPSRKIWKHHTKRGFAVSNHFSSNFIYTDGSGKFKRNITRNQIIGSSKFSEYIKDDFE